MDFAAHLPHLPPNTVPEIISENPKKPIETPFFQPLVMQFTVIVDVSFQATKTHSAVTLSHLTMRLFLMI
jgi:hypothetical protein